MNTLHKGDNDDIIIIIIIIIIIAKEHRTSCLMYFSSRYSSGLTFKSRSQMGYPGVCFVLQ